MKKQSKSVRAPSSDPTLFVHPKRCMIKFYMLALILVLIVAFGSAPTMEEQIADAQHMHQLLKTLDVAS